MRTNLKSLAAVNRAGLLYTRAEDAWKRGQMRQAFRLFLQAAEAGERSAYVLIGQFYDNGDGVRRDEAKALKWYRRAYLNGDGRIVAASNSGCIWRDRGRLDIALKWFRRAVRLNDGDANLELAKIYISKGDLVRAKAYLEKTRRSKWATEDSQDEAKTLLGQFKLLPADPRRAKARKAARRNARVA